MFDNFENVAQVEVFQSDPVIIQRDTAEKRVYLTQGEEDFGGDKVLTLGYESGLEVALALLDALGFDVAIKPKTQ